jgi:hypothetical protein
VMSSGDESAARGNMTTFYGGQSPATCESVADMGYLFSKYYATLYYDTQLSNAIFAVGLRQMRASQTGPIVSLRDVVTNTINTYGPASSGCGLDPAAATFCATNGCAVSTLYNQAAYSTATTNATYDTILSMTAASTAAQPTVTFNSLNGQPTMHFTGTQLLCTGTIPALTFNVPVGWSVVARRTASAGAGAAAAFEYTTNSDITLIGWGAGANTFNYWVAATSPSFTGTASDGHWHQMGWESNSSADGAANDYLDGATVQTNVSIGTSADSFNAGKVCLGGRPDTGASLSGDVAEMVISMPKSPTSTGFATLEPTIFSLDEKAWGTLPN